MEEAGPLPDTTAPVLSTPDSHIFSNVQSSAAPAASRSAEDELYTKYEIERTVNEIRTGQWKRVALQFPDHMLVDSPRVYKALSRRIRSHRPSAQTGSNGQNLDQDHTSDISSDVRQLSIEDAQEPKIFILADTSYGACCVDEVAAEHANADVVVHYGRSCLSPTARLPVIYVFTKPSLATQRVIESFGQLYPDLSSKVVLMADIPYCEYLPEIEIELKARGYNNVFKTEIVHNASSPLPNRSVPDEVADDPNNLSNWQLFHVSSPPDSLLLTLSSRVSTIHIFPTDGKISSPIKASTAATLRRRYALTTSLTTVPIWGILINTLSVKNYMSILAHVKQRIADCDKKSYTFVVGKVNAAKVANFSEVGGWVVIGCWESSLFDSSDFWKPVITPFELELALQPDSTRLWTGAWSSDFQSVLDAPHAEPSIDEDAHGDEQENAASDSEEESAPPEFDLRTGRYVSQSRPMAKPKMRKSVQSGTEASTALTKRGPTDLATVGGAISPAADFFRNKRTWQGLGSDFKVEYDDEGAPLPVEGAILEQGRRGIAKGYVVGDDVMKR